VQIWLERVISCVTRRPTCSREEMRTGLSGESIEGKRRSGYGAYSSSTRIRRNYVVLEDGMGFGCPTGKPESGWARLGRDKEITILG
jgi:hypothetical protein